jgi:hypothetical protein
MNVLKIDIKGMKILKIDIGENYKPYAFVLALYAIMVISTYYTTRMYTATMNHEIEDLTTLLIIVCTTIYLAKK